MGAVGDSIHGARAGRYAPVPAVRHIAVADLRTVLARGLGDFATYRTDVIFLCIVYPIAGLVLARSEEHTSELQSLMRISYAVFCLKKKKSRRKQDNRKQAQSEIGRAKDN